MNVTDLADPDAVAGYLLELGSTVAVEDARALAEDALEFAAPPAGAWTVLAHVAEHGGDYAGLERWTAAALDVDPAFGPALEDDEYVAGLRADTGWRAGAARRADNLLCKLDRFHGRMPQLRYQLDLAAEVLGAAVPEPTIAALDVCDSWQFTAFLGFEGGTLRAFDAAAGALLPPAERTMLQPWFDVRHRHVRMVDQARRRWTLEDLVTGETIVAKTLIETWWEDGREGFVLVAPVGDAHVVVSEPIVFPKRQRAQARAAVAALATDPLAVARAALRWRRDVERRTRVLFCFPGVDPDSVTDGEEAMLELVRVREPELSALADAGDPQAEADLLLEAITAHRIITRRTPDTWETAAALLGLGVDRDDAFFEVKVRTYEAIRERMEGRAEAA